VPEILAMFKRAMPNAHNLRKLQVCASCVVRNIFTSDIRWLGHVHLPRELKFSQKEGADEAFGNWVALPLGSKSAALAAEHHLASQQIDAIAPGGMNNSVMSGVPGNDMAGNNLSNLNGITTNVSGVGSPSHGSRAALMPVVNRLPVTIPSGYMEGEDGGMETPMQASVSAMAMPDQPSMVADVERRALPVPGAAPTPQLLAPV
jgi:hypothetical protein